MRICHLSSPSSALIASAITMMLGATPPTAIAADVWIVTDRQHPMHHTTDARVIELDAPPRIEAALSKNLPADPAQAADTVRQRLQANHGALSRQLASAWQAVADAWSLGVTTIPAVIVDRHYVVYGDPDAAHAVTRIQAYREAHP